MRYKQKLLVASLLTLLFLFTQTTLLWANILITAKSETNKLLQLDPDRAGKILAQNGEVIAYIRGDEYRLPLALKEIPDTVKYTLLAVEDKRFYNHSGIDLKATARAAYATITSKNVQGGSTLTQQLVKNLRLVNAASDKDINLARAKNLGRKITEAATAIEIEKQLTKDEIILKYLDTSYFGNGAWGLSAASQRYFSKTPIDLNWQEAATLVAILKSPTLYDPIKNPKETKSRRNLVLNLTSQTYPSKLSKWSLSIHLGTNLNLQTQNIPSGCNDSKYPVLCNWITKELLKNPALGTDETERRRTLYSSGIVVQTTLDTQIQEAAEDELKKLPISKTQALSAALIEPGTGKILAMAQHSKKPLQVNLADPIGNGGTGRQAGSTYKLFALISALESGMDLDNKGYYSPGCYRSTVFNNPKQNNCYQNTEPSSSSWYNLRQATAYSVNTFYVKLAEELTIPKIIETATRLGVPPRTTVGPKDGSVVLGSLEVTPLQMANAYATIAAAGTHCSPWIVKSVYLKDKEILSQKPRCQKIISTPVAQLTSRALAAATSYGTGTRANIGPVKVAGKTGTTNSSADIWFNGYNLSSAISLWVGDIRGSKYSINGINGQNPAYGGRVAAPIAGKILARTYQLLNQEKSINLQKVPNLPTEIKLNTNLSKQYLTTEGFEVILSPQLPLGTTHPEAQSPAPVDKKIYLGIEP